MLQRMVIKNSMKDMVIKYWTRYTLNQYLNKQKVLFTVCFFENSKSGIICPKMNMKNGHRPKRSNI